MFKMYEIVSIYYFCKLFTSCFLMIFNVAVTRIPSAVIILQTKNIDLRAFVCGKFWTQVYHNVLSTQTFHWSAETSWYFINSIVLVITSALKLYKFTNICCQLEKEISLHCWKVLAQARQIASETDKLW